MTEDLKEQLHFYQKFLEILPVPVFHKDKQGVYRGCNRAYEKLIGLSKAQIIGKTVHDVFPADMAENYHKADRELFLNPGTQIYESSIQASDGTRHSVVFHKATYVNSDEEVAGLLGAALDVTEQKEAEENLRRAKEDWEKTFDSVPDLIAIMDDQHRIVRMNKAMAARLDCDIESSGLTCYQTIHGTQAPLPFCPHLKTMADGREHVVEVHEDSLGGDFLVSTTPLHDAQGKLTATVHVARDITERKRQESERLVLSKLESTGILAGGIAHDFNNLLTIVLGNLDLIEMFDLSGEEKMNSLKVAKKAIFEAQSLTKQFIAFAKGGDPLKKLTDMARLIREQVNFTLRGSKALSEFTIPDELWSVEGDEDQISQVLRNIVLNAREAMPEGGTVSISAANLKVDAPSTLPLRPGNYLKISIADQGSGIPAEVLPKIFDPYFSTKQRGDRKGMGLGLTICHSIVEKHGGLILADSKADPGAAFHIYLPACQKEMWEPRASKKESRPISSKILVMDDDEMMRSMSVSILNRLGYEVELAENGQKAIDLYQAAQAADYPFDAVILDLTVPGGMGGEKAIQELTRIDPKVIAIASSGYHEDPVMQNHEQYGFKAALTKPYMISRLSEILSTVLEATPGARGKV
ncbi:MAG TPA: PAS domain-containing protein [Thermodesulfobacteriota bacterium]|nr:PAS domain-containing protein [Thermodesulfobacteriota bacterium]